MKPEISNQDWSEARHTAILINPDMLPGNIRTIAQAIAVAHQRGRREGMKEASPLLERLRHWIEDEVGAELPFTADEQDAFYAIRAKMEEQP